jgi:hypothetical protein
MKKRGETHAQELAIYQSEKWYDIGFMLIFAALTIAVAVKMPYLDGDIRTLSALQIAVLVLAVFRLTQLVTTDNVMQWVRDLVFDVDVQQIDPEVVIERKIPTKGLRRQAAILLDCPWCISMWLALATLFVWFRWVPSHIFFYILALSGIAASLEVLIKKLK